MNRSLRNIFATAMAAAMPLTLPAQTQDVATTKPLSATARYDHEPAVSSRPARPSTHSKAEKTQAGEVKVLERLRNAYSYYTEGSPFVYDEGTNTFFRVQRGPNEDLKGNLYLITSTDNGATWSNPELYYNASLEGQARYPSLQVINSKKSKNFDDLHFVFYSPVLRPKGAADATIDGAVFGFKKGSQTPDMFYYGAPDNNNPDKQKWGISSDWASDHKNGISYMVQTLSSTATTQYGQYGFVAVSPENGDVLQSELPAQWALSKFRPSDGGLGSSYNARPHIGIDEEGTLYTLINNLYADDPNVRIPAISKSTDKGKTWTELVKMPSSILLDYQTANGGVSTSTAYPGVIAYNSNGFVVLGKDKYSFVTQIVIQDNDANTVNPVHIVEFYYENGAWGIRKVADHSGSIPIVIYESSVPGTDTSNTSSYDNELQLVRTADGNLLIKYLDFVKHTFAGEERDCSDLFYVARPITSNSWGKAVNITNDAFFDKISWIPTSLPSLTNIPMIQMRTVSAEDPTTLPYLQAQQHIDDEQEIIQRNFTASVVGVNEEQNPAGLTLREAYPNPASGSIELPFSIERAIETKIELYTVVGEKVATLQSGMTAPGFHAVVLNTENLAAGAYYYTLTAGTTKLTKMLTVVR